MKLVFQGEFMSSIYSDMLKDGNSCQIVVGYMGILLCIFVVVCLDCLGFKIIDEVQDPSSCMQPFMCVLNCHWF